MQSNVVTRGDQINVVVFLNGRMLVADENHPNIKAILDKVTSQDESALVELFDATVAAAVRFEPLSETISVANGRVYVDGDEIDDVYAEQIVRFIREGHDFNPLVKFLEKVYTNNNEHTRKNLSRWLSATGGFTIDDDGDIRGYKGLKSDFGSIHHGPAIVDGVSVNGSVPNKVGSVIEMARSMVQHNPSVGCSTGLHVGTWGYAQGFSQGAVAEVKVNPRDVVSVPTDCNDSKMRVSRYKVVRAVSQPTLSAYTNEDYEDYDDEDYDY